MTGFLMAFVASVLAAGSVGTQQRVADGHYQPPSREDFDHAKHFPYVASQSRVASIRKGVAALRRCVPESEVRGLLGTPDFGMTLYMESKNPGPKQPWVTLWYYYLAKPASQDGATDAYVLIMLSGKQRLSAVSMHEVPDLAGIDNSKAKACE
ncbi:MAG: hypothetical protein ABI769_14830 [Pseudomonadota bacterium]